LIDWIYCEWFNYLDKLIFLKKKKEKKVFYFVLFLILIFGLNLIDGNGITSRNLASCVPIFAGFRRIGL
jgi:hypothetical protein